jgi:hypothetical protein
LKELDISVNGNVTDAGIRMVVIHCKQLRVLALVSLPSITGMCALCEDSEPTLSSIALWCIIFLQQVYH